MLDISLHRRVFIEALHRFDRDEEMLDAFLEDIFTPQEIEVISERLTLMNDLARGETQRAIATKLGVSITTVTRGSRVFQYGRLRERWRK